MTASSQTVSHTHVEAISITGLTKTFGVTRALDNFELHVRTGEVHGFLGPNGAGKSTTLRILLGLLRADSGEVSLLGGDPWRDAVELHRHLAYVPDDVKLWPNLSGGEIIDLLGRLRGGLDPIRRGQLIERLALDPTKKSGTYSKGNRQKVALVSAFASDVDLLLFDEPTAGLDPLMASIFRDLVTEARDAGRTVLLSSHILADVEALCERVSIIRAGRLVESGTLADLRHLTRNTVTVETAQPPEGLDAIDGVHDLTLNGTHAHFEVEPAALQEVLTHLTRFTVVAFTSAPPTLEQIFMRHYGTDIGSTITGNTGTVETTGEATS